MSTSQTASTPRPIRRRFARPVPVSVNGATISSADIGRETQHHQSSDPDEAWILASRALAIRELLSQEVERLGIEAEPLAEVTQFVGRAPRLPSAAAAHEESELVRARIEPALERAHHRRGDAGGVPVHPHHRTERLEPEGIAEAGEERTAPVVVDDGLHDAGAEPLHAARQPGRHASAVERQIGNARALHAFILAAQAHDEIRESH